METQSSSATCTALVPYIPSASSLFALIRQRVREATKQLRKIAPDISLDRLTTFIFYGLLGLIGSTAVVLGVFGGGAVLVSALGSVPYAEMAGFIATTIFRNPALSSAILRVIQTSVCVFLGEVVTVLAVKNEEKKTLTEENTELNNENTTLSRENTTLNNENTTLSRENTRLNNEKRRSDDDLKAKADEITQLKQEKEQWEGRFNNLEKLVSALIAATAAPHNAQPPVDPAQATPGSANPDVIY
ncbi:hypothetical protein BGZ88_012299 [Linnemannia elongata]|nr:hypothetical protein BGZ88_012299 [Linnemannia elongata]